MLFYGPDNQPLRRTIPMSTSSAQALCDGDTFLLAGPSALSAILVEPYCRHCAALGGLGTVALTAYEDRVEFRCAHIGGHVRTHRHTEVPLLLDALRWGLRCTACREDVQGDNTKTDTTFTVTCRCTTRELANPVPPVVH